MTNEELKEKSVFELATRLNEIMKEQNQLDLEFNSIVYELWDRCPSLKDDVNIQPTIRKRGTDEYKRSR